MPSNHLRIITVSPLPTRQTLYASHRSRPTPMASRSKDGRPTGRWALAAQEYDFTISYRKGAANTYAGALSHKQAPTKEQSAATLCVPQQLPDLQQSQANDPNSS